MSTIDQLKAAAATGDPAALYRYAAALDQAGARAEAQALVARAAAAGFPPALYTEASRLLAGAPTEATVGKARAMLEAAAASGGAAAMMMLATLDALGLDGAREGSSPDWPRALAYLARAARLGRPDAARQLAALALLNDADDEDAKALLAAAAKGDLAALYLAAAGGVLDTDDLAGAAAKFAGAGLPALPATKGGKSARESARAAPDIEALAARGLPASHAPRPQILRTRPDIAIIPEALPAMARAALIAAAAPRLQRSKVVDTARAAASHAGFRTSSEAHFRIADLDPFLAALYQRLAAIAGAPLRHCELMGVLRYLPGDEYRPHHDYLPVDAKDYSAVDRAGQRVKTLLVRLNEGFEGGATVFPRLQYSWRGAPGEGLSFQNVDARQTPYPETLHAGEAVNAGEKWLLTLWIRARDFWSAAD